MAVKKQSPQPQQHFPMRDLDSSGKRKALLAAQPIGKAIVFLHGFGGDCLTTWGQFPYYLSQTREFRGWDIYFFGYDVRANVGGSAAAFRTFLHKLMTATVGLINHKLPLKEGRPKDFTYSRLVVAAHSLGAVVSRRALIDATRTSEVWPQKSKLVLFAPAHTGARVSNLGAGLPGMFQIVNAVANFFLPAVSDLRTGSPYLTTLQSDHTTVTKNMTVNLHLQATQVILAEFDGVVEGIPFPGDPPATPTSKTNHTSVCKPHTKYMDPVTMLQGHLL